MDGREKAISCLDVDGGHVMHSLAVTIMYFVERYSHGLDPDLTPPVGRVQLDEARA